MVTVYRSGGLRVIIFVDDHEPAHVHVFGDGHAKIDLAASGAGPQLVWAVGMNRGEIRRAMRLVPNNGTCSWRAGRRSMADPTDAEIAEATARGQAIRASEPRATSARYEPANGRVIVELDNGCTFAFPARSVQGLERAEEGQIARVELLGAGYGLHWDALDVDISVPGLLRGIFGTAAHMAGRPSRPGPAAPGQSRRKSA